MRLYRQRPTQLSGHSTGDASIERPARAEDGASRTCLRGRSFAELALDPSPDPAAFEGAENESGDDSSRGESDVHYVAPAATILMLIWSLMV